ncbi:MAG: SPOR domain-containing protein [Bacteroidales bacterium]|jgi:tRNA(Ser,Leu) C12 N-acetylase TAN1|nr:SPOR domain-containing protein [Bacteroidales bacterium]
MTRGKVIIARQYRVTIRALMILFMSTIGITTLVAQQKPSRQSSLEAFSKGNYEQALSGFSELLITYPKDPLYKYYRGVCLIKLNRDPEEALLLLQQAQQGSAMVRTIPPDVLFWLGRARQMTGRFDEAISAFDEYTLQYGKKAARDLDIPLYVQQCHNRKGQLSESASGLAAEAVSENKPDEPVIKVPEVNVTETTAEQKAYDTIPGNFDLILSEALDYQFKADSLNKISEQLKGDLEKLDFKTKTETRAKISETESLAAEYQKKADIKYNEAQASMNSTSFAAVTIPVPETIPKADSLAGTKIEESIRNDTAVVKEVKTEVPRTIIKSVDSFSVFELIPSDAGSTEKIPVNSTVPPGLIYRIQVAVFRNQVARSYFKGITPIYGFRISGNNYTTYYAGMFRRVAEARKALVTVKQKGFKDAFVVAFSAGKSVSLERAALLEKEWGKKPFIVTQAVEMTPADTIPPELCFRVEVARSVKPLKQDALEAMIKIAGIRGFDTETAGDGSTVYLIGKFITYDSALSYTDLLIRNGYRDAKVVARLGKKEVPVETARTLFEQIE